MKIIITLLADVLLSCRHHAVPLERGHEYLKFGRRFSSLSHVSTVWSSHGWVSGPCSWREASLLQEREHGSWNSLLSSLRTRILSAWMKFYLLPWVGILFLLWEVTWSWPLSPFPTVTFNRFCEALPQRCLSSCVFFGTLFSSRELVQHAQCP